MKNSKQKSVSQVLLSLSIIVLGAGGSAAGASQACSNELGGSWNFGTVPNFCNISPLQVTSFAKSQYATVIYNDAQGASARGQYMSQMYPVVREMASYYIHRRNPKVSAAEAEGFTQAVFSLVSQESYWSHYRMGTDKILRSMRGDSLHGYGIMQLDDRSHAAAIQTGHGTDLVFNMVAGLDIFYAEWVRSATISCVPSASDYRDRARAAWAAYNGGGGSICRWKNSSSKWARNDQEFFAKYTGRPYLPYVKNTDAKATLDVRCLAEGKRPCAAP